MADEPRAELAGSVTAGSLATIGASGGRGDQDDDLAMQPTRQSIIR
jgi:hypothetical protein